MSEPTLEEIQEYMAETGFGYPTARAMLMKASVDDEEEGTKKDG